MTSIPAPSWRRHLSNLAVGAMLAAGTTACLAQARPPVAGIYTCTDDKGRRLTSDRPIPECTHREQQVLNKDGSVKTTFPPSLTAEERAEQEMRDRKAAEARAALADAARRDRNLLQRFPNETAHRKSREAALDTVRLAIRATEQRVKELAAERKPLLDDAEFYKDKPLPLRLRNQLDANDAAMEAQRSAVANQEAELARVNRLYDIELGRLQKLWAGAPPGSMGQLQTGVAAARAASAAQ